MKRYLLSAFIMLVMSVGAKTITWQLTPTLTATLNNEGRLVVNGTGDMPDWNSIYSVPWYDHDILKLEIHDGVTSVGGRAFKDHAELMNVELPASVTNIGWYAFYGCNLSEVNIPANVTYIGGYAFADCKKLLSVDIPEGLTEINTYTFYGCSELTDVTIPSSITNIRSSAFSVCTNLTSVAIPSSVISIGSEAFNGCKSLSETIIADGVKSIGVYAFLGCVSLPKVIIPSSVTSIGEGAFWVCNNLNAMDFEGPPPSGLWNAKIKKDVAVRYNALYEEDWLLVIANCGFTNATPYRPCPSKVVISPENGTVFDLSVTVSMTTASAMATIHYTTNGLIPTRESPIYVKKFRIWRKTVIKAIAFYDDGTPSEMSVAEYAMGACKNPVIAPADGTMFHGEGQEVSIAWIGSNGVLRVTTDGSEPTNDSPKYSGSFTIDDTTTVKAKVFSDVWFDSEVVTATLTRERVRVATPEIAAAETFLGSKNKVTISCATEGAAIYYTLDGSDPTTVSLWYEKPFCVTGSCTIKAIAVKDACLDSGAATLDVMQEWSIGATMGKRDHTFSTDVYMGFVRTNDLTAALGESMRSMAIGNCQTSTLSTVVIGSGTLTFKWKTSCEADELHEWDHAEFIVDGEVKKVLDGITDWQKVSCEITGNNEHAIVWRYVKDDSEHDGEDCLWVSEYTWKSELTETQTTDCPVPYSWLIHECCDVVDEYDSYEKVAKRIALNGRLTVEQCYIAGLDPESISNDFTSAIEIIAGVPRITWNPDLKTERTYKISGSANLANGGNWECPTNASHRFFKVTVEMK